MRIHTALILFLGLLAGCTGQPPRETAPHDPWEGLNRKIYAFNENFDEGIATPVAEGYQKLTPDRVDRSISDFFSNLDDIWVFVNDLLQLKGRRAVEDGARFTANTTLGVAGLFDVATHLGLPKHYEDFGQTLGRWGVRPGPYLVLPFLGPSTLRDTAGLPVDWYGDPLRSIEDETAYWRAYTLRTVDTRADLLRVSNILEQASLDPYTFMRDAYLQRRRSLVYDGSPPREEDDSYESLEEFFDQPPK